MKLLNMEEIRKMTTNKKNGASTPHSTAILNAMRVYCEKGLYVFPLKPKSKIPDTPHGFHDATNDYEVFKKMYRPDDEVALETGLISGIVVLDLDVKKDKDHKPILEDGKPVQIGIENLFNHFDIKDFEDPRLHTKTVLTQSGGCQLYYRPLKGRPPLKQVIGKLPGVDLKAEGGYVVAPPSIGKYGKYEVIKDVPFDDLLEMPEEFYDFFAGKPENEDDYEEDDAWENKSNFQFEEKNIGFLVSAISDMFKPQTGLGNKLTYLTAGMMASHNIPEPLALAIMKKAANINSFTGTDWIPPVKATYKKYQMHERFAGLPTLLKLLEENKEKWANYADIVSNLNMAFPENLYETLDRIFELARIGPRRVMLELLKTEHIVTKSDNTTDLEEVYIYHDGFYSRGEEEIKGKTADMFTRAWKKSLALIETIMPKVEQLNPDTKKEIFETKEKLKKALDKGPTRNELNETLAQIRIATYTDPAKFNPSSHIPFLNGFLNTNTWKFEPHNPDLIYLWREEANLIVDKIDSVSLKDVPLYAKYMKETYEPWDIPLILQYCGYSMYPTFPRQMVMWITGRPRIGKGTFARILKKLNPAGYGSISFEKLIMNDNKFVFQGIEGKNVLVDPEVRRYRKKGSAVDYGNINKLFGGDTVDLESKGKTPIDYVSSAKGIFVGNLPMPKVNDEPFLSRIILVKAKDHIISPEDRVPNLEDIILARERDLIATLFIRYLRVLASRNWIFLNELTTDATMEMWETLSEIIQFYMDDEIENDEEGELPVNDVYESFCAWCKEKGIPVLTQQTFTNSFKKFYPKKQARNGKERYHIFTKCAFVDHSGESGRDRKTNNFDDFYRYARVGSSFVKHSIPRLNIVKHSHTTLEESIANIPDGPVKNELVQNKEDIANEEAKHQEEKSKQQPAETLPENANQEITKDFIEEIRETLETENFMLDGNHGLSFDKKDFQLYVHPTDLPLDRFTRLKAIMKGFGFQYSLIQAPYGIRFIRKIRGGINE